MNRQVITMAAAAAMALTAKANSAVVVGDANAQTTYSDGSVVITMTQSGTLTVTQPGEIELLLVGGGGGAGGSTEKTSGYTSGESRGGGGGGGGVIHKTNFQVAAGYYPITVGAGGAICTSASAINSATGGNTTGFGLTALGGGPGGCVDPTAYYDASALVGASGGGGSKNSSGRSYPGGSALASAENENLGNKGANAYDYKNGGGGGGAGSPATNGSPAGGDGYACDISGETVYYGGGGGGGRRDSSAASQPGLGGGKSNYGGGGTGQMGWGTPESGGPGIVIVRFTPTASSDFRISGYNRKVNLADDYVYLVFTNSNEISVEGSAPIEILLVGGGGGAGGSTEKTSGYTTGDSRGGGGGGGGVIHTNILISAGAYPITIGEGGAVNTTGNTENLASATGGSTTGFGFTALGGGPGAPVNGAGGSISGLGASGGGGATSGGSATISGGSALASGANGNLGNNGADATSAKIGGGGGGAGAAASGVAGGDGYACDITGETAYYGGGGKGGERYSTSATPGQGGGMANWGGGGSAQIAWSTPESGGHGIVIIRYRKAGNPFTLVVR